MIFYLYYLILFIIKLQAIFNIFMCVFKNRHNVEI